MKLTGKFQFDADQQTVWDLLMNPNAIAKALPSVETLVPVEGENLAWRASAKLGVAAISGTFTGIIRMTELQPPSRYRLNVSGEGQQSAIGGFALISLTPSDDRTKINLTWEGEATISGKLAGIGQRLIAMTANLMANQFFQGLAKQLPPR
jgi:carbon monoxide dehydrogenase subunit G